MRAYAQGEIVDTAYNILKDAVRGLPNRAIVGIPLLFTVVLPLIAAALADLFPNSHALSAGLLIGLAAFLIAAPLVAAATALRVWHLPTVLMALLWTMAVISGTMVVGHEISGALAPAGSALPDRLMATLIVAATALVAAILGAFVIKRLSPPNAGSDASGTDRTPMPAAFRSAILVMLWAATELFSKVVDRDLRG